MAGILKMEQVVNQWGTFIEGAAGLGEGVINNIERLIEESEAPNVKLQRKNISPGIMQAMLGGKRPFLVVSNTKNPNTKLCKLYISARDYGVSLQICWYLVQQPSLSDLITNFLLNIPVLGILLLPGYALSKMSSSKISGILGLSLFDEQDLTAFTSNAHHRVMQAVDELTKESKIEMLPIDRKASGFLNVA